MKHPVMLLTLIVMLLLTSSSLAGSSPNYRLDWFTPLTSGGGGATSSTHYAANFTVGQTAIGASTSNNYHAGLGYWYGIIDSYRLCLPLVLSGP